MSPTSHNVALVTGAASGIGASAAVHLSDTHTIIAVDRDEAGLTSTAQLVAQRGGICTTQAVDVTDFAALRAAVEAGEAEVGRISSVAACAGVEVLGTALDLELSEWRRSIDVNLGGVFHTAKATLPSLVDTRGTFVAIASDAGTDGASGFAAYVAAKHGVVGLVRCMALDFGPKGVRSNVICPGLVETPMARRLYQDASQEEMDFYERAIPLGRFATPDEVAEVIGHFVRTSYANGTVYALDGGSTAGYFSRSGAAE